MEPGKVKVNPAAKCLCVYEDSMEQQCILVLYEDPESVKHGLVMKIVEQGSNMDV